MGKKNRKNYYNSVHYARRLALDWLRERGLVFPNAPDNATIKQALIDCDFPSEWRQQLIQPGRKNWVPLVIKIWGDAALSFNSGKTNKPKKKRISFTKDPTKQKLKTPAGDFYRSDEWRALRYAAFAAYGRKCGCCGASPETGAVMHVDHIKPRFTHPELALELSNLQILCADCNQGKGAWDSTDWRWKAEEERLNKAFKDTVG